MTRMVPFVVLLMPLLSVAQTASTGQIAGAVRDASGAAVPGAQLKLTMSESNATRSSRTDREGRYAFALLAPGTYQIDVDASGFGGIEQKSIPVRVTETTVIDINLQVASIVTTTTVESGAELVQTASSALGRIVESAQLVSLPLATRNYTQILALSPGVVANVANAGALGRNSLEISALGGRFADNNVQINGADGNNVFTTNMSGDGAGGAQGIAVPAPDSIREFKVQTGLYDASTGRNGGASVNVVTKSGGNHWHGNLYHFFRNEAFNAGEFFLNRAGQPKPRLRQNQFGFTLGGPLRKDSTFFFVSYEGNRQNNGVTGGATSAAFLPPLTDDRSAGALGRKFGGQRGAFGGVAVSNDGSNINPVAMRLLNQKLADGTYMIPTPQLLLPNGFGQSNYSVPARFREDQFNANLDQHFGSHDSLSFKFFFAQTEQTVPFGAGSNVPGFPSLGDGRNENASLSWVHIFRPNLLNEARVSFARLRGVGSSDPVLNSADVGIKTPPHVGVLPNIGFLSFPLAFGASQPPLGSAVNNFQYADSIAYHRGAHRIRAGAEFKRIQSNVLFDFDRRSILRFQTFPDFLIGLPFAQNQGSQPFSNVFVSSARSGLIGRAQRMSDFSTYVQDDFNPHPRLSLNIGLRYEIYGQVSDATGRLANFELGRAAAEPPASGTLTGFVVAANSIGSTPSGVVRLDKNT
ncbi:MAG: carboxypeptidase regulatory-like domain-containing protein, partial [Candidatus Solibacter usitatus]|nr:carboxypeptidase regulatory-like domain-containing protein [Candidatus Solibacter usitatus]